MADRLRQLRQRAESIFAIVSFGASSLYWLALAFTMSATEYGAMMTAQAAVLLIVAVFTFRTHDLVYYLVSSVDQPLGRSWRIGLTVETAAAGASIAICAAGAWLFSGRLAVEASPVLLALFALLASLAVMQGATIAKLRHSHRADRIVRADAACIAAWGAVAAAAVAMPDHPPAMMLVLGAAPQAVRTVSLIAQSLGDGLDTERPPRPATGLVAKYLAGGQMINVAKNGATSIETMIVAAFAAPGTVAMYRLAKSTLGAASAAGNVAFQQGFASIAKAPSSEDKARVWRGMDRRSLRLFLAALPLSAGFALVYGLQKPEISIVEFELITLGVFAAFVPSILLQGPFVIVSVEGRHGVANRAFLLSLVVLLAGSTLLFAFPSIWVFLAAVIASSVTRYLVLARAARTFLAAPRP